jgi:hypothetical protein
MVALTGIEGPKLQMRRDVGVLCLLFSDLGVRPIMRRRRDEASRWWTCGGPDVRVHIQACESLSRRDAHVDVAKPAYESLICLKEREALGVVLGGE